MIRTIIIEDEPKARSSLEMLLETWCPAVSVIGFAVSVKEGIQIIEELNPDLVFLDIKLKDSNGFEILKHFHACNFKIIFTTAFEEYAIKAFKLSALDYLLKPIDADELQEAVQKAIQVFSRENLTSQVKSFLENYDSGQKGKTLVLKTTDNIHLVKTEKIIYCESDNNYTRFYLQNKQKILVSKTLKEYEEILEPFHFLRIHQSYLINMSFLEQINKRENQVVLADGIKLPVSTRKKEFLFSMLRKL